MTTEPDVESPGSPLRNRCAVAKVTMGYGFYGYDGQVFRKTTSKTSHKTNKSTTEQVFRF